MTTCLGHSCRQGRAECKTPNVCSYIEQRAYQAAEAATELGVDDDEKTVGDAILDWITPRRFWISYAATFFGAMLAVWVVLS